MIGNTFKSERIFVLSTQIWDRGENKSTGSTAVDNVRAVDIAAAKLRVKKYYWARGKSIGAIECADSVTP